MKKLLVFTLLLSGFSVFAEEEQEFVCSNYRHSRSTGTTVSLYKGHSNYSQSDACQKAARFCREAIRNDANSFCTTGGNTRSYDGRYRPAIAYHQGRQIRKFPAVCHGSSAAEAKSYCESKMMKSCRAFISGKYNHLCSFR